MTTAHRPTWHFARGGDDQGGNKLLPSRKASTRDQPAHKKLKLRQPGQNTETECAQRDFVKEIEDKEAASVRQRKTQSLDTRIPTEASGSAALQIKKYCSSPRLT